MIKPNLGKKENYMAINMQIDTFINKAAFNDRSNAPVMQQLRLTPACTRQSGRRSVYASLMHQFQFELKVNNRS